MTYFGGIVGRVANRIAGARFECDGKTHDLDKNFLGRHILHGGSVGTGSKIWKVVSSNENSVQLSLSLPDGDMGFPGNLEVAVTYSLLAQGTLQIDIVANTDAATPCNFAHHSYFNLDGKSSALGHQLQVDADAYLPVDRDLIPTGEIKPVAETDFDFKKGRQIEVSRYDHNLCLSDGQRPIRPVARLTGSDGKLSMRIETTEPGLQFYDGGQLPATGLAGQDGRKYRKNAGIALEAQGWPDAVNVATFPNSILRPEDTYTQKTRYVFERG
jgi:aldose 1-epimerase